MERPLTEIEQQVLQRHQQMRDQHLQQAQEQQNILIEFVTAIGGQGAEVDLAEGTIEIPEENPDGFDDGMGQITPNEVRDSGDCEGCGDEGN